MTRTTNFNSRADDPPSIPFLPRKMFLSRGGGLGEPLVSVVSLVKGRKRIYLKSVILFSKERKPPVFFHFWKLEFRRIGEVWKRFLEITLFFSEKSFDKIIGIRDCRVLE